MRIDKFPGLITDQEPFEVGLEGFVTAENVDLSKNNKPSRREGYSPFYAGATDAAWGDKEIFLLVEGRYLKSLHADGSAEIIKELVASSKHLRACRAYDNRVYWSTGTDAGVIEKGSNRPFGVLKPTSFTVDAGQGSMPEARYMLGLVYVNARGVEGPMAYTVVDIEGEVTINIPHTPLELFAQGIENIRMFVSYPDGEVPYLAREIAVGETTYMTYSGDTADLGIPAEAENLSNMPTDGFIAEFAGRLWTSTNAAEGGMLVHSDPYSELTNLVSGFIPFPDEITGIGGLDTGRFAGLYVGTTERVYFLQGTEPERMNVVEVMNYGMIPGTMVKADGRLIGEGANTSVLLWSSPRGVCAGYPEGEVNNLTQRRIGTLTGHAGTAIIRRANGQSHLMTVLRS